MDKQSLREVASYGDQITVTYLETQYTDGGRTKERVEKTDTGTVKAIPSKKFSRPDDSYLLDYELDNGSAVRSINFDSEAVSQLFYDAGGDRDWQQWALVSVTVNGNTIVKAE
jgi:hypothetical protein